MSYGSGHQPKDTRPANCRNRQRDELRAYPRSSCVACGQKLLIQCPHEARPKPPKVGSGVKPPKPWAAPIVTDLTSENARLRRALKLITQQYMGAGGNLRPEEVQASMERIAHDALAPLPVSLPASCQETKT